ncbi:MAG: GlsB/YeaQ/YmgE family stress response membrane protein [Cystobacter sp.]
MAIFIYTFIGLVMGVISFVAMPATRRVGLVGGGLLGMAGGTLGGLIGTAIVPNDVLSRISPMGIVLAVVGSLLVSVALLLVHRERPTA